MAGRHYARSSELEPQNPYFRNAWGSFRFQLGEAMARGRKPVMMMSRIAEGAPEGMKGATLPKFRPGGILIVHCGGGAGLFSAMIGGWVNGELGSQPVVREIRG